MKDTSSSWNIQYKSEGSSNHIEIRDRTRNLVIIETELTTTSKTRTEILDSHKSEIKSGKASGVIKVYFPNQFANLGESEFRNTILNSNSFEYAIYCPSRYPENGWVNGTIHNIAFTAYIILNTKHDEYLAPIHACMTAMEEMAKNLNASTKTSIAKTLNQPEGTQTWKMAGLILSNAMVFYDLIADRITLNNGTKCKSLDELRNNNNLITHKTLQSAWHNILDYNYNPIFSVALKLLSALDRKESEEIIKALDAAAIKIRSKKATGSPDMYGKLLQRVITDRDNLASYYTSPEAATLIATLAVPLPDVSLYKDGSIARYRVADFACGTGLLLSSAYRQIIFNYEASNPGTKETPANVLHKTMMEKCLIGLDVLPIATHLAVSALAMMFPMQIFGNTSVKTMPIGLDNEYVKKSKTIKSYRLGSLDLISSGENATLIPSLEIVKGKADDVAEKPWSIDECHHHIGDESCDLLVMNPPFVRATNHAGQRHGYRIPTWAAFDASEDEQKGMSKLASKKFRHTCAHGNAGLASYFIAIAHKKIHKDGTLALILPATISQGESWKEARILLQHNYDIKVISIAKHEIDVNTRSFSSDTGMAEIILLAKKRSNIKNPRGLFISLQEKPQSVLEAIHVANTINNISGADRIETGYGGTTLRVGDTKIGSAIDCKLENGWKFVNVVDPIVEQNAYAISYDISQICTDPRRISITQLENTAMIGPSSRDIIENDRGPFNKFENDIDSSYLALWNNVQQHQTKMIVPPDVGLKPKTDSDKQHVDTVWATASHVHVNINPDLTANSLIAAYTKHVTIGGSSWPSLSMNKKIQKPFTVWCNSTFGILAFWSFGGKQQLGRIRTSRTAVIQLPVPDFDKMNDKILDNLGSVFDEYSNQKLDRVKNLWRDKVRMLMDDEVAEILGITMNLHDMRLRFCMEPSVSGGRPEAALIEEYEKVVKYDHN